MSQTPQSKTTDSLDPLAGASLKILTLPNISRTNTRKTTIFANPVEKKVLDEVNHDDIDVEINNTEMVNEYFREDPEKEPEDNQDTMKKKFQNGALTNAYESYFKPKVFFKFLLMHALFYCLMGPSIVLLVPIFGYHVLYNQGFVGVKSLVWRQSAEFLIIVSFLIMYYMTDMIGMQAMEVYMMFIAVMIRIITISSKYSYQTENFLKMVHTMKLTKKERSNDLILGRWRIQNDEVIQEEIQAAILRLEVDSPTFFFNFMGHTSSEMKAKLMKVSKICRENSMTAKKNHEGEEEAMPCMKSMDTMRERNMDKTLSWIAPKSQRDIGSEQVSFADTPKERASFAETPKVSFADTPREKALSAEQQQPKNLLKASLTKQLPASGTAAVFKAFSHFFDEKQLEHKFLYGYNLAFDLIKTSRSRRFHHLGKKILLISFFRALIPTFHRVYLICYKKDDVPLFTDKPYIVAIILVLNTYFFWVNTFTLAQSVQSFRSKIWCFKQIGYMISPKKIHYFKEKKMYPTLNIFDPITLKTWSNLRKVTKEYGKKYFLRNNLNIAIAMVFYSFMFCTLMLQAFGVFTAYDDPLMFVVFGFETFIYFLIFANVMMGAAFLNSQYATHKNLLKKNKTIISDFQRLSYLYVGRDAIKPDNIIYKEGLKILKNELGEDNFREKLVDRSKMLTEMIDDIIEDLNFEENNEPFMVMGVAVNYTLLKSLAIGGISLAFALGQSLANA